MGFWKKLFGRDEAQQEPQPAWSLPDIEALRERQKLEEAAGTFEGRHYTEWVPELNRLRSLGADSEDEYLRLVLKCVDAAERASVHSEREPAPGYTERAAVIYRRRKDYAAEIAIIERWEAACPPERRGPGATQERLATRLTKARQLLAAETVKNQATNGEPE